MFVHYELRTTDPGAAARFYGDLLGWEVVTYPGGAAFRSGDVALGGASRTNPGVPPHWTGFIRVSDVDGAASAAASAGGIVTAPPVDIPGFGRLSVVLDAQRAVVGFVSAGAAPAELAVPHIGAIELHTPDVAAAAAFYGAVVGWTLGPDGFLGSDGAPVAGIRLSEAASWLPQLFVPAVEPVAARAAALGGAVEDGVLRDPQGAVLALRVAA